MAPNPVNYQSFNINIQMLSEVKKQELSPIEMKQIAMASIKERYPSKDWLRIFTDGSQIRR